ncbi:hypothetical protein E2C01_025280 [Portunus trituberculatus]|uniref:Uncharacterized protein n=1 Tax=Portunus trituberculatus TaxID=210409 RepID=A0A5B7EFC5_PORTR|nr:hypothetical protein [Portunus trituberculatus]
MKTTRAQEQPTLPSRLLKSRNTYEDLVEKICQIQNLPPGEGFKLDMHVCIGAPFSDIKSPLYQETENQDRPKRGWLGQSLEQQPTAASGPARQQPLGPRLLWMHRWSSDHEPYHPENAMHVILCTTQL